MIKRGHLWKQLPEIRGIMMRGDEYSKRIREEFTSPRVNGVNPREEKKELPSKWDFQEGKTVIDRDTEQ